MSSFRFVIPLLLLAVPAALPAQSFYFVSKQQQFLQTSATGAVADPLGAFKFQAKAATSVTLTLPGGGTFPSVFDNKNSDYALRQFFATKAALDAAFPNGTYRMTGASIPAISLNLAADNYPVVTPQVTSVTNGTWNSGGVLVVNPAQPTTLNFSTFSGYATSGVAGLINFYLTSMSGDNVTLETEVFSQAIFGAPATPTPLTSYSIPAGRLTSGRLYRAWLVFDTVSTMDTTSIPGSAVGSLFSKEVSFYLAAQAPGTSTPPPVIVTPPTSVSAVLGGSATFTITVTVGGSTQVGNIPFIWSVNGQEIQNLSSSGVKYSSTGSTLTINNLTAADAGDYTVTVVTGGGVVTSSPATLSFAGPIPPVITTQPRGATVNAGSTLALTATATGTPTPAFQWRKDGQAIIGATSDTLVLANVTAATAGNYTVFVSNSVGSVTSNPAAIVVTSGQPSRLPNLSVRANLGASQTLIVGFATIGAKTMLVRGIGPTLAAFGLSGVLPDPVIELFNSASVKIDENNDWSASLASAFADVGAFALTSGSPDAALLRSVSGPHTAQIKSVGSGVVLVEVYDSGGTGKLVNVSARNAVGTGDNILIAGFVVDGTAAKTLLIRGVGAKLVEFGVGGVLADAKLEIYNAAGAKIAENDNWNALLQPVARSVGAFDLTLGSRDAALLITLAPGTYTAQISGIGGTTGEAIVEVYEVP
ncbi:MAG: immunoglobulin domain-containing protein [Opitutaceae bacterium]|nr:immunoglobulin domain-containing protein [Opitutaceae bacterium]